MSYQGLQAETVSFRGYNGDQGEAYYARPARPGKVPGIVVIHHMPGWDEWITEVVRKCAHRGFAAIAPHLFFRFGPGSPDDVTARARPAGGAHDNEVVGDVAACIEFLQAQPNATRKVGVIGFCSGGRHAYLASCSLPGIDAVVDCWGGRVIVDDPKEFTPQRPIAPITLTEKLACPLLGIFGNDDKILHPIRWTALRRSSSASARTTNSTATTVPAMHSSTTLGQPTGRHRRSTAGRKSSRSSGNISRCRPRRRRPLRDASYVLIHCREGIARR